MDEEIYPMPAFPTLLVSDLEASARFYQEALGFKHVFTMPGPGGAPALAHLRWVKYADLLIARPRASQALPAPRGAGVFLTFNLFDRFGGDIDAFARQAREKGAQLDGPVTQPWNVREVTVVDPDGYCLVFTVQAEAGLGFDQVLERARAAPDS
jgi:catechol 2,3-dioxygenase-like lactoylglutathione lyase family enzyme